jgi:hypothetical protein
LANAIGKFWAVCVFRAHTSTIGAREFSELV